MSTLRDTVTSIIESDSMWATIDRSEDGDPNAVSPGFVVMASPGDDRDSALIVEVKINHDNTGAIVTVTGFVGGEPSDVDIIDVGSVLITSPW